MPAYEPSHYEKKQMEMDRRKDNARPSLIKRIGVGLLDFVFAAIFAGALFAGAYFGIFPKLGYNEAANTIVEAYDTSHLYHNVNGNFTLISEDYDSDKTPEENYDGAITTFYKEKSQAKLEEKYKMKFPLGASKKVDLFLIDFVNKFGKDELGKIAKMNFANIKKMLG